MMASTEYNIDPRLDLMLERVIDVPRELVWKAWTTPEYVTKWFTPAPWQTVDCKIDLRPGGDFYFVMRSPEGEDYPYQCCYLEVVEEERLVWTDALAPGYRPSARPSNDMLGSFFTAMILLEAHGSGTKYTAIALHPTEAGKKQHEEMGFHDGWGTALDQLVEFVKTL